MSHAKSAERVVQDIRRKTRRRFSAEEKIRIVLRGCGAKRASRPSVAGKGSIQISITGGARSFSSRQEALLGETTREATSSEVGALRQDVAELKAGGGRVRAGEPPAQKKRDGLRVGGRYMRRTTGREA